MLTRASAFAGIRLANGTYSVSLYVEQMEHLYFACGARATPFEVDFGGSTLVFQVRPCRTLGTSCPRDGQPKHPWIR